MFFFIKISIRIRSRICRCVKTLHEQQPWQVHAMSLSSEPFHRPIEVGSASLSMRRILMNIATFVATKFTFAGFVNLLFYGLGRISFSLFTSSCLLETDVPRLLSYTYQRNKMILTSLESHHVFGMKL